MGLTKKQLQSMITEAVKVVIIKEIKPMIRKTIRQEFYKIVEEAGSKMEEQSDDNDNLSMFNLLREENKLDETRQVVQEKLFKSGKFADILNNTANQYQGKSISSDVATRMGINEQKEILLSDDERISLIDKMGYGDGFDSVGSGIEVPGENFKQKSPLKSILNKTDNKPKTPTKVSLPTKNADGRPINLNNVPAQIIKNMMKDYSGMLKKVENKSNFTRGGGNVQQKKLKASLDTFNKPKSQFEKYEEDKK